jgi:rhodanese-related sulfurtransferase
MPIDPNLEPFTRLDPAAAAARVKDGAVLVDVREPDEWSAGHAAGAIHVPLAIVFTDFERLPVDRELIFICKSGQRSAVASEYAAARGATKLANVEGGTDAWREAGLPIE